MKTGGGAIVCELSPFQNYRISQLYRHSLIALVYGKKIRPSQLAKLLYSHLHLIKYPKVTELSLGYFVLQFSEHDYLGLEDTVPWSIPYLCITVFQWTPNFKPSEETNFFVDAWIRLHDLPLEYYDHQILRQIAETIGCALLKIDPLTKNLSKCKYARICVRILMCLPPITSITLIGSRTTQQKIQQEIQYEGFDFLCTSRS